MENTLNDLVAFSRAQSDKRCNAIDKAIKAQCHIRGEAFILAQCLEVMTVRQKALLFAEILATGEGSSESEADSLASGIKDGVKLVVIHGQTFPKEEA